MQQQPRAVSQVSGGVGRAGPSASLPVLPLTPRKDGRALNQLMRTIEDKHHLGLPISNEPRSRAQQTSPVDVVANKIQLLFYKDESALHDALKTFASKTTFTSKSQQLDVFLDILKRQVQHLSPTSRVETPLSSSCTAQDLKISDQVNKGSRSLGLFSNYGRDTHASPRAIPFAPGSPTDENKDDIVTYPSLREPSGSPSPTTSSKSAKRKVEASDPLSLQSASRKRLFRGCLDHGKSKKLTTAPRGKQPFHKPQMPAPVKPSPSSFKMPSLAMARAFSALPASQSTVESSFDAGRSSQSTRADSVSSFDDEELHQLDAILGSAAKGKDERADTSNLPSQGYVSTSNRGLLIPEQGYEVVSARAETSDNSMSSHIRRLSSRDPAQDASTSQSIPRSNESRLFDHAKSAVIPVHQSPPPLSEMKSNVLVGKPVSQPGARRYSTSSEEHRPLSRNTASAGSPRKHSHHIRDIPKQGLFVDDIPEQSRSVPYHVLFICQRVALNRSISLRDLLNNVDISSATSDSKAFWSLLQNYPKIGHIKAKEPESLLSAPPLGFEGFSFKGQINLSNKESGPVFSLHLQPIQTEKPCRLQRRFGSDRFLYLKAPKIHLLKTNRFNQADATQVRKGWADWLLSEHRFLGRKWGVFHIEPIKGAKNKSKKQAEEHDMRVVLFATSGLGIEEPCSLGEMVNWFFPFARNATQSFCKAYARLDLALSRTVRSVVFKPSQVRRVRDILANGENEASEYNDPSLHWDDVPNCPVMNDGCSRISVGAAHMIWEQVKRTTGASGPLPSVIQGRIGGAKGMWMVNAEPFSKDPEDLAVWIEISDSQLKFEPHEADLSDETFDQHRLTFEVTEVSSSPAHADLHIAFISILADRSVSRDVLADVMIEQLNSKRTDLLERLLDLLRMYEYIYRNGTSSSGRVDMQCRAALPEALDEKIKFLLESGFLPAKCHYLARMLEWFVGALQVFQESVLRVPLGKATNLYGVADPYGVLKPGEIHVQFSTTFVDELTSEGFLHLRGHDVLVARQPACRRSDVQKVRATVHAQLSHLVDVVVFSSRGQFPLAGKLQGGDYDGDKFWLCWEDKLVRPFLNAPAPVSNPDPSDYGIKQDKRKISDVMDPHNLGNLDEFRRESFQFRNSGSVLGIATLYREQQSYRENRMHSSILSQLDDIHDLLVDAPKQGYLYTQADFERTVQTRFKLPRTLPVEAHKEAMKDCSSTKQAADLDKVRNKRYRSKKDNTLDFLYFEVVRAHNLDTMECLRDALSKADTPDPDLLYPRQRLDGYNDHVVAEELRRVQEEVESIYRSWCSGFHKGHTGDEYKRVAEDCYRRYQAIQPQHTDHALVRSWTECDLVPGQCPWDTIRASTLYYKLSKPAASRFVFTMAGRELGELKARNSPHARSVVALIRENLKPRRVRAFAPAEEDEEEKALLAGAGGVDAG
ncbi:RNA-directed RNA polymerase [Stagonosporopsis vannaccii]|nr:RNA-directed RNA polymerase [Stagonosporopsis vannaccii]